MNGSGLLIQEHSDGLHPQKDYLGNTLRENSSAEYLNRPNPATIIALPAPSSRRQALALIRPSVPLDSADKEPSQTQPPLLQPPPERPVVQLSPASAVSAESSAANSGSQVSQVDQVNQAKPHIPEAAVLKGPKLVSKTVPSPTTASPTVVSPTLVSPTVFSPAVASPAEAPDDRSGSPPQPQLSDELRVLNETGSPDHLHGSISPRGHPSLENADIADIDKENRSKYNPVEMAKKPSTSSLDRSDIVDFVVDDRSPEETKAIYNSWANNYEEDMNMQKYKAPNIMAHFINQELKMKKDAIILDVGCGTGLLGVQLKNLGYSLIDALDYSEEMMSEAKKKSVYKRLFLEKVTKSNRLPLKDGEYDIVALCGSLMPGHILPDALPELARLVRVNGYLMWIHRTLDHYEHKSEQFLETRFTSTLLALCKQLRMELVVRKKVQEYRFKSDGQIFAIKKK